MLDNNKFVSCSVDKTMKIWNLLTGECLKTLKCEAVFRIETLPNNRVLSSSLDGSIKVWCLDSSKENLEDDNEVIIENSCDTEDKHIGGITMMPNDQLLSCSGFTIKQWDLNTRTRLKTLVGHTDRVISVDVLPGGRAFSCSQDKTIKIWNLETGECLHTLEGHTGPVNCVLVLSANRLASGSNDKSIKIWDLLSNSCTKTLIGHHKGILELAKITNEAIASCSTDGIKVWNLDTGNCIQTKKGCFSCLLFI